MTTIMLRRGSLAEWLAADPVLSTGEPGFVTDTGSLVIGDGVRPFSRLAAYVVESRTDARLAAALDEPQRRRPLALSVLDAAMASRATGPVRIVFVGSSTTAGAGAAPKNRYVDRFVRSLQASFPSGTAAEAPVVASTTADAESPLSSDPGVRGYNFGIGGTTSATYLTADTRRKIADLRPVVLMHMVGANDYADQTISPQQYADTMSDQLLDLSSRISGPHVHVLAHSYRRADVVPTRHLWSAFGTALRATASLAANRVFVDLSADYVAAGLNDTDPFDLLSDDRIHQTVYGYALMADLMTRFLGYPLLPTDPPAA